MYTPLKLKLKKELQEITDAGLYKKECIISSPQSALIRLEDGREVINFCANNYLGLSSHPDILSAAKQTIDTHGFGLSSVRFLCGTQDIHKELENKISTFLGMEDTILYAAAFDANGGLFEPLLGPEDAIFSDELNHASLIDGIRLCKAKKYRFRHNQMDDLESKLMGATSSKIKMIVTDGVFSMDGTIAQLDEICMLAEKHNALVVTDDCHATGFIGKTGRGVHEHCGVMDKVDIITGTLGKALGGSSGGFTSGKKEIIELLRQRSRPYLFSNTLAPSIVGASLAVISIISESTKLRDQLARNTDYFRSKMIDAGFEIKPGLHPIVPIMLYDAQLSQEMASELLKVGIYVIGFYFPVVPKDQARIRVQLSAIHTLENLDSAIRAFIKIGKKLKII